MYLNLQSLKRTFSKESLKMSTNKWLYSVPIANFLTSNISNLNLIFNILEFLINLSVSSRRKWSCISKNDLNQLNTKFSCRYRNYYFKLRFLYHLENYKHISFEYINMYTYIYTYIHTYIHTYIYILHIQQNPK